MSERTESFTFFKSFRKAAKLMSDEDRLAYYDALIDYAFTGEEQEVEGVAEIAYVTSTPIIDSSISKKKSSEKANEKRWKSNGESHKESSDNPNGESHKESSDNPNKNKNKKKNKEVEREEEQEEEVSTLSNTTYSQESRAQKTPDTPAEEKNYKEEIRQIVNFLNVNTGQSFKATTPNTQKLIRGRLNGGYTVDDFKAVISFKAEEWGYNEKMKAYLRPDTLFRPTNFEDYLQQSKKKGEWCEYSLG